MKINCFACMRCFQENGQPSDEFAILDLIDDDLYEFTCKNGHTTRTVIQPCRFEILFDIGLFAFLDGYYDAAVSRFYTALERFYEFCIMVSLYGEGLGFAEVKESLKAISKYSEREFGAFSAFYSIEKNKFREKQFPELLNKDNSEFRNKVIHKGYIPSKKESENFGNKIYQIMTFFLKHLKTHKSKELGLAVTHHQRIIPTTAYESALLAFPTAISVCYEEETTDTFLEMLEKIKKRKRGLIK